MVKNNALEGRLTGEDKVRSDYFRDLSNGKKTKTEAEDGTKLSTQALLRGDLPCFK